jgi:hypothetical protein
MILLKFVDVLSMALTASMAKWYRMATSGVKAGGRGERRRCLGKKKTWR